MEHAWTWLLVKCLCENEMNWKKILIEAGFGFALWTAFLTPYMIFIVKTSTEQYGLWIVMQAFIIPPLSPIVFRVTKYVEDKLTQKVCITDR